MTVLLIGMCVGATIGVAALGLVCAGARFRDAADAEQSATNAYAEGYKAGRIDGALARWNGADS